MHSLLVALRVTVPLLPLPLPLSDSLENVSRFPFHSHTDLIGDDSIKCEFGRGGLGGAVDNAQVRQAPVLRVPFQGRSPTVGQLPGFGTLRSEHQN